MADIGIVYWDAHRDVDYEGDLMVALLIQTVTIPGTGYRRPRNSRSGSPTLESRIGEVLHHIVLEGYLVFTTDLNKVF